jgi:hypothetical protein
MSYGTPQSGQRTVMAQKILQQSREAENALADALVINLMSHLFFYTRNFNFVDF